MKLIKNLTAALGIGLASAGLTSLENTVQADVYVLKDGTKIAIDPNRDRSVTDREREQNNDNEPAFYVKGEANINGLEIFTEDEAAIFFSGESIKGSTQPYVSIGNKHNDYKITLAAPRDQSVSVTFPKGKEYACGIDGRYGDLTLEAKDYGFVSVRRGETDKYIPVIKTSENFRISSGDMIKIECEDGEIQPSRAAIDFNINTPAFLLLPRTNGELTGGDNIWFCDNYGRFYLTHVIKSNEHNEKNVWNFYIKSENGNIENMYFATRAFARLSDKNSFWRNTSLNTQFRLRTADYNTLKRYAR